MQWPSGIVEIIVQEVYEIFCFLVVCRYDSIQVQFDFFECDVE